MTKPDDVPKDVWDAAVAAHDKMPVHGMQMRGYRITSIARAIMAEREACAQVAESEANGWDDLHMHEASACLFVATAIRNRT